MQVEEEDLDYSAAPRWTRITFVVLTAIGLLYVASPFWLSLLMAALFAMTLNQLVEKLGRWKLPLHLRVLIVVLAFVICGVAPAGIASYRIATLIQQKTSQPQGASGDQAKLSIDDFQEKIVERTTERFEVIGRRLGLNRKALAESLNKSIEKFRGLVTKAANRLLSEVSDTVVQIFVFLVALYSFLANAEAIKNKSRKVLGLSTKTLNEFICSVQGGCRSVMISNVVVGLIQSTIVGVGALVFGYREIALIFLCTFFVSFIPVVGAAPVAFVLAINSLLQNDSGTAVGLAVVGVVAGTVDNIIRPLLVGGAGEIPPLVSLVAVLGGVITLGIPGLFVGPLLACFLINSSPHLLKGFQERLHPAGKASRRDLDRTDKLKHGHA